MGWALELLNGLRGLVIQKISLPKMRYICRRRCRAIVFWCLRKMETVFVDPTLFSLLSALSGVVRIRTRRHRCSTRGGDLNTKRFFALGLPHTKLSFMIACLPFFLWSMRDIVTIVPNPPHPRPRLVSGMRDRLLRALNPFRAPKLFPPLTPSIFHKTVFQL